MNLGLIPNSEVGWPIACAALKPCSGGILHVHGNVTSFGEKNNSVILNTDVSGAMGSYQTNSSKAVDSRSCDDNVESFGIMNESDIKGNAPMNNMCNKSDNACSSTASDKEIVRTEIIDKEYLQQSIGGCNSQDNHIRKSSEQSKNNEAAESENASCALHSKRTRNSETKCSWSCDKKRLKSAWIDWSQYVAHSLYSILFEMHKKEWTCTVSHVEHVKSYAPHIDHLVVDIHCIPSKTGNTH